MRRFVTGLLMGAMLGALCCALVIQPKVVDTESTEVEAFVGFLLEEPERFESVAFREVVSAVSGCEVLPIHLNDHADAEVFQAIEQALERVFQRLSVVEHPIHEVGRVNEISRHIEDVLLAELDALEGYQCTVPMNASGDLQRSGYPDLRLLQEASGRVLYLDPKVYKQGSEMSSFRTFYFEPQRETNKILDTASHLIVGIAHGGKREGLWRFESWRLVDLYDFKVRLKAEFQASNRDLYGDRTQPQQ